MTWLAVRALFGTIWGFLKSIPWPVWAFISVVVFAMWYGERRYDAGVAAEQTRWEAAQALADATAHAKAQQDAGTSAGITDGSQKRTTDAVVDTRTQTATAVERVRHATRTIIVPADCPTGLPDGVSREGREAIERANAAHRPMRGATNP